LLESSPRIRHQLWHLFEKVVDKLGQNRICLHAEVALQTLERRGFQYRGQRFLFG
jgi:hypothetical protein